MISELEKLRAENERLRDALIEAMEWNWIDGDVPSGIVVKCLKVLPERFRDRWRLSDTEKAALADTPTPQRTEEPDS